MATSAASATPDIGRLNWAYIVFLTLVAALGGVLFGYDTAVISGAIVFVQKDFGLSSAAMAWAAASALIGSAFGAAIAGLLSDAIGRKRTLLIAAALFLITSVGAAVSDGLTMLVVYRIVGGVGVGVASIVSPLYIAEIAPARYRGRLVSVNQFALVAGMLLVYSVNYAVASEGGSQWNISIGWRWMFASEAVPAVALLGLVFLVPESPRWLVQHGRGAEALQTLSTISDEKAAAAELDAIVTTADHPTIGWRDLVSGRLRALILVGVGLAVLQQITGINVFLYFAPEIFESVTGAGSDVALLQTVVIGIANLAFTMVAILTVDRVGRRPLMLIGFAGMTVCLTAIGIAVYRQSVDGFLLIFVIGYIASFAVSVGPVTWVLLSEMFPTSIRGFAMGVAATSNWLANFVVSQTFPMMDGNAWLVDRFNHAFPFLLYAAFGLLGMAFVYRFIPETRGHSLEKIESMFRRSPRRG
ncbi:MAG: sugar porter family MFS transporter [Hyphomicrobiales bacterium]|nr:sugar porter family MFS transporter [Hyphomicrobiales bacterium]